VPAHMTSTIQTRVVGIVELDINYTSVAEDADDDLAATIALILRPKR